MSKIESRYGEETQRKPSTRGSLFFVAIAARFRFVLLGFILCSWLQVAHAQSHGETFRPTGNGPQNINPYLEYLDDPEGQYSVEDVASGRAGAFKPLLKPNYGFGYRGIRWVRFKIDNDSADITSWFIHQNYNHVQNWSIFYPTDDGFHEGKVSADLPSDQRQFHIYNLILKLPTKTGPMVYYGRYEPRGHPLNINLSWFTQKGIIEYIHNNLLTNGIFFGGLAVLILYNAFICITLRSKVYLQYVYYLTFFAASFFYLIGLSPMLLNLSVGWKQFFGACSFLAIHGMAVFGRNILELKDSIPLAAKYIKFCEALLLIGAVGSFFAPIGVHYRVLNPIILFTAPVLIAVGIRRAKQGYVPAKIYSVGWFMFLGALICYVLMQFGVLPINSFTIHAVEFASVLEATLFSFALALRFKIGTEQAAKAKNSFIGMVSHELRTPLQTIVSSLDLMSDEAAFAKNQKLFHRLKSAVDTIELQVGDLTDFARLESGTLTLRESVFTPAQIVQEMLEGYEVMASKKGLIIHIETIREEVEVKSDQLRVRQIVSNLLENAIKYTNAGTITIRVGVTEPIQKVEDSRCELLFEIEDTGIGISEKHLAEIYEPFTQIDQSTERKYEGIGMGLTIVKNLTTLMHGKIEVESILGKGSLFSVSIPCSLNSTIEKTPERAERLLLVDDNEEVRQMLEQVLGHSGFKFESCSTGRSAVFNGKIRRYSSALLDINIPDLNGFSVAKRLREMPHHRDTPIIWISAAKPDIKDKKKGDLFTHFLEKPIHADKLNTLLNSVLAGNR